MNIQIIIFVLQNKYQFQIEEKDLKENMTFFKIPVINKNEMFTESTKYVDRVQHNTLRFNTIYPNAGKQKREETFVSSRCFMFAFSKILLWL